MRADSSLPPTKTTILTQHEAKFDERIVQASSVFLTAKNEGKKIQVHQHTDRLYHPLKPLTSV